MRNLVESWIKLYLEQKYKIEEMADDAQKIREDLKNGAKLTIPHLIYCFLWNDDKDNLDHWKQEVLSGINDLPRYKGTKKLPTLKNIQKWYLNTQLEKINDNIDNYVINACRAENKSVPQYNKSNLISFLQNYFIWLMNKLTDKGSVNIDQVSQVIDELLSKYKQ